MSGQQPSAGDTRTKHEHDVRQSSFAPALPERMTTAAAQQPTASCTRDGARSIVSVLSEDNMSTKPASAPSESQQGPSFLSKFARAEVKSSKSLEKSSASDATKQMHHKYSSGPAASTGNPFSSQSSGSSRAQTSDGRELECDRVTTTGSRLPSGKAGKSFCELEANRRETLASKLGEGDKNSNSNHNRQQRADEMAGGGEDDEDEDDDNDQVLPVWPSRMDAASLKPSLIQHQVYSLKDYSQVAGPTESVPSSNVTPNSRLLKSMSQDRKVDTRMKRMSESILSGVGTSNFYSGIMDAKSALGDSRQRNPSVVSKISANNLAMGPATSVSSLLQPPPSNKSVNLIGESRIDRMRKLFVSPLSLRGSTSSGSPKTAAHQASSGNSRLSIQAGANMLNKPQHLMHAMYRTRAAVNSHHTRRSPMRQKQGKMKGFRVYGCPLSMANTMYPITCFGRAEIYKQQSVPYILARLCNYIEENSSQLTHEGIFRVSGNARLMEKLKTLFDHLGDAPLESESVDVATSASMLKMYLRELPDPLIPTRMNHYFFTLAKKYATYLTKNNPHGSKTSEILTNSGLQETSSVSDTQSSVDRQRLAFLRDLTKLIRKLPIENYNLLKYLTCFLHRVALKQHSNKMSAEALGIVFGPNVFRIRSESYKGLKEQELSNQIMASIISNYKLIFDCELTDPLGNLVARDEALQVVGERGSKGLGSSSEKASGDDKGLARTKNIATSSPSIPSTSAEARSVAEQEQCARHAHRSARAITSEDLYGDSDDSDDEDEGDDDDDIDDLDEECDDGSYSPSSGSGSYCSSLASESVESVYEGDAEADQYEDDIAADSNTSSRCGSETSYTPSSSHSESDADVDEMSSSNFSSSPSPTKLAEGAAAGPDNVPPSENPCRVCKRRESAQIERLEASRLREQAAQRSSSILANTVERTASSDQPPTGSQVSTSSNAAPADAATASVVHKTSNRVSSRASTRKRRSADEHSAVTGGKLEEAPSASTSTRASSDVTLVSNKPRSEEKLAKTHFHPPRHQAHKQGILRRRSSSASSLLQIATERHAMRRRIVAKNGHHNAHSKAHSDRKRHINETRNYSRKSRSKNYPSNVRGAQNHSAQGRASSSRNFTEWTRGDHYIPELIAMNLPNEIRKDLVWNYVSSSFLEVPEAERYFQLRSYNSDETLLRSQEAESELAETSKGRRRFSGQELLQTTTVGLLASTCPRFSEIFESSEGDNSVEGNRSLDRSSDLMQQRSLSRSNVPAVESSVISLLGDQMISFKHSRLSLDDETDPIVLQLQVTKDFIKILRKLLKHGCSKGFDQDAFNYLVRVIGDFGSDNDDCTTCYVDSITGKSAVMTLDSMKREFREDTPRVDKNTQERLERLLSFTITSLKKRYNNLKYIREHYRKHCKGAAQLQRIEADSSSKSRDKRTSKSDLEHATVLTSAPKNHVEQPATESEVATNQDDPLEPSERLGGEDRLITGLSTSADERGGCARDDDDTLRLDHGSSTGCKYGTLCPIEFVYNIEKQLASRRAADSRLIKLDDMSLAQIQSEKLELQKNLLRYEHWFGRPSTRSEFNLVGHLYERYRAIKIIKQNKLASSS